MFKPPGATLLSPGGAGSRRPVTSTGEPRLNIINELSGFGDAPIFQTTGL